MAKYDHINFRPTDAMAAEAKRGLEWRQEFGRGGTAVGVARARDIANKANLSPDTVKRMVSFFARHEVNKQAEGFRPGEDGYPSNGRIAWALWGGDPGMAWANARKRQMDAADKKDAIMDKEYKSFSFVPEMTKIIDGEEGVVEHIVAVMGNVDEGGDVIHPGAFAKTIGERMGKIRVLDQHRTDSVSRVLGKPIAMREMTRQELPSEILVKYPQAVGALWCKTQYLLDTPEGAGAFKRIKAGAIDEYSIGYDVLDKDYSEQTVDGKDITVRNLRTLRLWEYSPVLWGMNPATTTLSAKGKPEDEKPYTAIREGDQWAVYKVDEEGEPVGSALGMHDTEAEAAAQIRALYAAEDDDDDDMEDDAISKSAVNLDELKTAVENAANIMTALAELIKSANEFIDSKSDEAGPDTPPTDGESEDNDAIDRDALLDQILLEQAQLDQLEIELALSED